MVLMYRVMWNLYCVDFGPSIAVCGGRRLNLLVPCFILILGAYPYDCKFLSFFHKLKNILLSDIHKYKRSINRKRLFSHVSQMFHLRKGNSCMHTGKNELVGDYR